MTQAGFEELRIRPTLGIHCFPDAWATVGLYGGDTRLAAAATFGHALDRFQGVEIVAIHAAEGDAQDFFATR